MSLMNFLISSFVELRDCACARLTLSNARRGLLLNSFLKIILNHYTLDLLLFNATLSIGVRVLILTFYKN